MDTEKKKSSWTKRKKLNLIIVLSVVVCVVGVSLFCGLYFGLRTQPKSVFARAERNWLAASDKEINDEISAIISVGTTDKTLRVKLDAVGTRSVTEGKTVLKYSVVLSVNVLDSWTPMVDAKLDCALDGKQLSMKLIFGEENPFDWENVNKTVQLAAAPDMSRFSFYNLEKMSLSKSCNYSINDKEMFSVIKSELTPLMAQASSLSILEKFLPYVGYGRALGTITYANAPYSNDVSFAEITSSQNITLDIPWDVYDAEVAKLEGIPEGIKNFLVDKQLSFSIIEINLPEYSPDSLVVNVKITTKGALA